MAGKQLVTRGKAAEAARQWALVDAFTLDPSLVAMNPDQMLVRLTAPREDGGHGMAISRPQLARDLAMVKQIHADQGASVAEDLRGQELLAIQRQEAALWPAVLAGDHRANESMTKLRERKAKMMGLDLEGKDRPQTNIAVKVEYVSDWRPQVAPPALPAPDEAHVIEVTAVPAGARE